MAHARSDLRTSIKEILAATPTAQAQSDPYSIVFSSFELAKEASAVPSFSYWIETEPVESIGKLADGHSTYQRTVDVVIIVLAKTIEMLDDLCAEVETGFGNVSLGLRIQLTGTTFVENTEGEHHYYGARLSYAVVYSTASNDPSQSQYPLSL